MDSTTQKPTLEVGKIAECPIELLSQDPGQPRRAFDKAALQDLANSIAARGILQPIQVRSLGRQAGWMIVDGERRWRAAKLAKAKSVPVILVEAAAELDQLRVDQVAVNHFREQLSQLELGFILRRMRDNEKKTTNDIAAFLAKNGMAAMTQAEVDGLIALTYLPTWTHELVDKKQIELKHLAPMVKHANSKQVMEVTREVLTDRIDWGDKATAADVHEALDEGLGDVHEQLDGNALFDWKKICQGCPNLVRNGSSAFCSDAEKFEAKQGEAKKQAEEKGRKPKVGGGGDKVPSPTKAELAERTKKRTGSLRGKAEEYLHAYLMRALVPKIDEVTDRLVMFAALKRPGLYDSEWHHSGAPACHYPDGRAEPVARLGSLKAAQDHKIFALEPVLAQKPASKAWKAITHSIALETLFELPFREVQVLAHHVLGDDIAKIWTLELPFLDLFRKGELAHVAKGHKVPMPDGVTDWAAMKGGDLRAAILEHPKLVKAPKILVDLYAKIEKPDRRLTAFD